MQNRMIKFWFLLLVFLANSGLNAQSVWQTPIAEAKKISFQKFTDDHINEGMVIYERACQSCHGQPTKGDFTLMVPSPGDLAEAQFQEQSDGEIFYKISAGRNLMPSFDKAFSEDEIWNIVAYIRSFNKDYDQQLPNFQGVFVPEFAISLDYDENVDKLVVQIQITNQTNGKASGVETSAYIKSMFGKLPLGTQITPDSGLVYFDVDSTIPGDENGNLTAIVKLKKGYGFAKVTETLPMGSPLKTSNISLDGQLWSPGTKAPLWLKLLFFGGLFFLWSIIVYVIIQLGNIRKYSKVEVNS